MKVEMENNSSCLFYFELLFTDDVYEMIFSETIRFERQNATLIVIRKVISTIWLLQS